MHDTAAYMAAAPTLGAEQARAAFIAAGYKFSPELFCGLLARPTKEPVYGPARHGSDETGKLISGGNAEIIAIGIHEGKLFLRRVAELKGNLRLGGGGYWLANCPPEFSQYYFE